jgi:hypothetical protein
MEQLLSEIEAFMIRHEVPPTRFGDDALGDRHLVRQLRGGRRLWPETEAKVRDFMATYRPVASASTPADQARAAA